MCGNDKRTVRAINKLMSKVDGWIHVEPRSPLGMVKEKSKHMLLAAAHLDVHCTPPTGKKSLQVKIAWRPAPDTSQSTKKKKKEE